MKERSYHKTINQLAMYWIQEHTHKDSDFIHIEGLVPFYYNMLSSLCLLRSKQKETMLKGQALLEKLLPFYLRGDNCPNFIHEFPSSTSNFATLSILPVLFWILEDFHKTFSPHLLLLLKTTLEKLASDIKIIYQNKEKISPLLFKSFACLKKTLRLPLLHFFVNV